MGYYAIKIPVMPKIIKTKLSSKHYDDPLADYFDIEKNQELIARKYYCLILKVGDDSYVKGCDVYLASKSVKQNLYSDLQSLLV